METFLAVEKIRRELQAATYTRLDDAEAAELRGRLEAAHQFNAMEGVEPSSETAALFAMFLEERVPLAVSEPYLDRFLAGTARDDATVAQQSLF